MEYLSKNRVKEHSKGVIQNVNCEKNSTLSLFHTNTCRNIFKTNVLTNTCGNIFKTNVLLVCTMGNVSVSFKNFCENNI